MANPNIGKVLDFGLPGCSVTDVGTGGSQPAADATDGLRADAPTFGDSVQLFDAASPQNSGSFEHTRIVDTARQRLFGRGRKAQIGRYPIERRLGAGGMGEVYLAHDGELDRKVAVKRVLGSETSERDRQRLRSEARALARLSHPNVVQVYEVGEHEQCTYLVMEYVDGETLGDWLAAELRPWRAVLSRFMPAGRGLAAAHEAGLVHRDFKPANVLLASDGSVRVADFGLALTGDDRTPHNGKAELSAQTRTSVTGAIRGTIRYMPLEQLHGEAVDARSDQFSFCVALYEALWGAPPFSIDSSLARLADLERGVPAPPVRRSGSRPPARLWRVIRRGLSKDPSERWPDMAALLEQLDDVTRRRRRVAWIGSVSAALILGAAALIGTREGEVDPCAVVAHELDGVWDQDRRGVLEQGVASVQAEHASESRERIFAGLDRWSQTWVSERESICLDSAAHRIEPELARLQGACLTRQRQQVEDLVGLLLESELSGDVLASAVEAVAELPSAVACSGELAMLGVKPPAPGISDQVEQLRREVVRASELRLLGRVDEGLTLAQEVEREARGLGYGPLLAEALAELAKGELAAGSLQRGIDIMLNAIDAAERSRLDRLAADLWTDVALRTLTELDDADVGSLWLRRAQVANDRVEAPARAQARVAFARGQLAELRGDVVGAELGYREAIAEAEEGEIGHDLPSYLSNLARLVDGRDPSNPEVLRLHRRALTVAQKQFGPAHPQAARRLYLLASALQTADPDSREARALLRRAADIWTASHARPHRELAKARLVLAKLALAEGDLDLAERHTRELVEIQSSSLSPGHRDHGEAEMLFSVISGVRGDHRASVDHAEAALAIWESAFGVDSLGVLRLRANIGSSLLALGELERAAGVFDQLNPRVGGVPWLAVTVHLGLCEVGLRAGELGTANAELRAIERIEPRQLGGNEFSYLLLRALTDVRAARPHLVPVEMLRKARAETPLTDGQIAAWLDQLGVVHAERIALGLAK